MKTNYPEDSSINLNKQLERLNGYLNRAFGNPDSLSRWTDRLLKQPEQQSGNQDKLFRQ